MTDEERQRAMDFIVTQQAKNSVAIGRLIATGALCSRMLQA